MIKSEIIKEAEKINIRCSIIINLDVLKIVQNKLLQFGYDKIEYKFSFNKTCYTCNGIEELRFIFNQNGISEISKLDIDCEDKNNKSILIKFGKSQLLFETHLLSIYQAEKTIKSHNLVEEIINILNEKNEYKCKKFVSTIVNFERVAFLSLFLDLFLLTKTSNLTDDIRKYLVSLIYIMAVLAFFILNLSSRQDVRILAKKEIPTFSWKDISIGLLTSIIGGLIVYFITN